MPSFSVVTTTAELKVEPALQQALAPRGFSVVTTTAELKEEPALGVFEREVEHVSPWSRPRPN